MGTRIVIDTNVLINVLIGDRNSSSRELLIQCFEGTYQPVLGNALYAEYLALINRDTIKKQILLTPEKTMQLVEDICSIAYWVRVYYLWRPNLRDEDDNHLIDLAIASNAKLIATQNIKDFQRSQLVFPQLEILQPKEIIRR